MSATTPAPENFLPHGAIWRSFWFWAGAVILIRIVAIALADGDLGPDEAQYWNWAQAPDFGYFSKPPMIAWVIAATTGVFGNSEWAVRLAAPLLHGGSAAFIYLTAARLFDRPTAFVAGLTWLTLPGVSVSSFLITTDAPLLLFWSGALFFVFRITANRDASLVDFAALGAFIGLGLLSKYAMLYFVAAFGVAMAASPSFRNAFLRPALALSAVIAVTLFAPNIVWNAANDFQTVAHTAANANWAASLFKPGSLALFLGGQMVVFGPVLFGALFVVAYSILRNGPEQSDRFALLIFTLTPLVIVAAQSFISRAHANWAAAAYPAGVILVSAFLMERRSILAKASLALHTIIAVIFLFAMTNFSIFDRLGAGGAVAELRGWKSLSAQVASQARGFDAVLFDDRSMIAEMLYYQRDLKTEVAALDPNNGIHHHYEAFFPFRPEDHKRSLFVSILPTDDHVSYRFGDIRPMGSVIAPIGAEDERKFTLFAIGDYYGPPGVQYTD